MVFEEEIPFGQFADLDVDLTDVVRLRLVVEEALSPTDRCGGSSDTRNSATWADPLLYL